MSSIVRRLTPVARGKGEGGSTLDDKRGNALADERDCGGEPAGPAPTTITVGGVGVLDMGEPLERISSDECLSIDILSSIGPAVK